MYVKFVKSWRVVIRDSSSAADQVKHAARGRREFSLKFLGRLLVACTFRLRSQRCLSSSGQHLSNRGLV